MYKIVNFSQNLKVPVFRKYVLLAVILYLFSHSLWAQQQPVRSDTSRIQPRDSIRVQPAVPVQPTDSLNASATDTLQIPQPQGDITTTINYNARDSIVFDVTQRKVYMFGDAAINYGDIKLTAEEVDIDWNNSLLSATGVPDSLGKDVGKPVFTQGQDTYVTDKIRYNFKSRRAVIEGVVTQQQEAYIHGKSVRRDSHNHLYIKGARYTTCNLEHPHYYIEAEKLKVMPNDKIIAGPFHLRIADISTPFGFLFGMFPMPKSKRVSGVIIPSYGEESRRGFFLREGGYYWAVNEYIDLAVTGEIYTRGSRGFQIASNYRNRYQYAGNFNLRFNRQNVGQERSEADESVSRDYWVNWSHNPESRGNSRFSASVNFGSSSFNNNNPSVQDIGRTINQQFSSSINYSTVIPNTPFSFSARASMVQNVTNNTAELTLPDVALTMQRQYPFRPKTGTGKSWWQQINFSYTGAATNRVSTNTRTDNTLGGAPILNAGPRRGPVPLNFGNLPMLLRQGSNGVRHTIPVSTSVTFLKHFTVSPSFNYQEVWYFRELEYTDYNSELGGVRVDTLNGFSRAGTWNTSAGLSTKLYGYFYFNKNPKNKNPKVQAIRHMIIPSVSFGYAPDFSQERFGNQQNVLLGYDNEGEERRQLYSVYNGFAYGFPQSGRQGSIGFSVTNNFEMKVREKGDTATTYKKVPLLERLSFSSSYNMLADSMKLAPISISGNTSLFNNLIMLSFGGTLNPYMTRNEYVRQGDQVVLREYQVDRFMISNGQGLGRITNANIGFSTSLSSKGLKGNPGRENTNATTARDQNPLANREELEEGTPLGEELGKEALAYRYTDPNQYVDFTLPWTLRFNYTLGYTNSLGRPADVIQSANFSGDLTVTEKWKVGYSSGFDIKRQEFTMTRLSIYRDLHCWQMNVNWVPFGRATSFSVDIRVKASVLQDLKLSRRRSFWDN